MLVFSHDSLLSICEQSKVARGAYQRDFLRGYARLSGSDLQGAARKFAGRYKRSREAVLERICALGLHVEYVTGAAGRAYAVVSLTEDDATDFIESKEMDGAWR